VNHPNVHLNPLHVSRRFRCIPVAAACHLNCDRALNFRDINPFVMLLSGGN
jgi:hypothetical protein